MEQKEISKQIAKNRISFYILMTIIVVAFAFVGLAFYWSTAPYKILEIKNQPVPVVPTEIDGDRYITAIFNYCKNMDIEGKTQITLVSKETVLELPKSDERARKGCRTIEAPLAIPPHAATDTYHYHFVVTYHPNPLRTVVFEFDTEEFNVIKTGSEGEAATRE